MNANQARLSALFALDAFAGGLVVQSIVAYWFYRRFALSPEVLGAIFFGANILAGLSALAASRIARRIGLLNTMVFTHLPSNVLLVLVPFMPTLGLAIGLPLCLTRFRRFPILTRAAGGAPSRAERCDPPTPTNLIRVIPAEGSGCPAVLISPSAPHGGDS